MSGLPPNRPVNANDTDIDNYTAPPEGRSRTSTTTRTSCPAISRRWASRSSKAAAFSRPTLHRRAWSPSSTKRWSTRSGRNGTRSAAAAAVLRRPGAVVHGGRRREGRQAGRRRSEDRNGVLLSSSTRRPRAAADRRTRRTMNVVLRTTLPLAAWRQTIERVVREADPHCASRAPPRDGDVFAESIRRRACWRSCSACLPAWRCCWRRSAPTGCCRTWSPNAGARSAFAWRSARIGAGARRRS